MRDDVPFFRRFPRLTSWILAAVVLAVLIALVSPAQLPVVAYKLSLISLAAVVAYWLDRALFPYARPHSYLQADWRCGPYRCNRIDHQIVDGAQWLFIAATLRRALIVLAVTVSVALGL